MKTFAYVNYEMLRHKIAFIRFFANLLYFSYSILSLDLEFVVQFGKEISSGEGK